MYYAKNKDGNLTLTFDSNINIDNGYTNESKGIMTSEMELFTNDNGTPTFIEWIVNDGVFELPIEAVKLIRKAGYKVPKDFLD